MLRLPMALRDLLEEACEQSRRSLTAEILARLEGSFHPDAQARVQAETAKYTGRLDLTPAEADTLAALRQITPRQRRAVLKLLETMTDP